MKGTTGGYTPRRPGEVVGVEVTPTDPRPVRITLFDHPHRYEVAWAQTDDGPVITDLRITSNDGTAITSNSVRRINVERLAKTAARHHTPQAAQRARDLRAVFETAVSRYPDPEAAVADACDWLDSTGDPDLADVARQLRSAAADGAATVLADALDGTERRRFTDDVIRALVRRSQRASPPKLGRPTEWTPEHLALVAQWSRDAMTQGGSVYERVADRATDELGHLVSAHQVKWWITQCKQAGLLGRDELRRPRTRAPSADPEATTPKKPPRRRP